VRIRAVAPDPGEGRAQRRGHYDQEAIDDKNNALRRDLERFIPMIISRGVLFGAVDKIVCRSATNDGDMTQWDVRHYPIGDMTEWNKYHFNWGVPGSSSLEASGPSQSDTPGED
jgi:hypothetical protein